MSLYPVEESLDDYFTRIIKQAAEEVFNELGSGHSEAVYEAAMVVELGLKHIPVRTQVPCPIYYKHTYLVGMGIIDILVYNRFVLELKAVAKTTSKDVQQVLKYLDYGYKYGFLINFPQGSDEVQILTINKDEGDYPYDETTGAAS